MNLALFDFDGTITKKDSLFDFIYYSSGLVKFVIGLIVLAPVFAGYILKIIPNWKAKENVLSYFFRGWDEKFFSQVAAKYSIERLPALVRKTALDRIEFHKSQGDRLVVVSASADSWLKDWCNSSGLELIGTELEVVNNKLTGKIFGRNCYGREKVKRIKEKYNLDDYKYIYAYGDSSGDIAMLEIADEKYYRWRRINA